MYKKSSISASKWMCARLYSISLMTRYYCHFYCILLCLCVCFKNSVFAHTKLSILLYFLSHHFSYSIQIMRYIPNKNICLILLSITAGKWETHQEVLKIHYSMEIAAERRHFERKTINLISFLGVISSCLLLNFKQLTKF